ncbi:hypothetical protein PACTADRAFT_51768 [Pachysolen tannophilus NRRL Y-2460]|uniref:CID domain-containing protein n=1 Tax=Pachysolen tannophilus NRRL Y-2460 TaxID=669874 RepID=A0A1E4TN31_PACTA|nr:hypothetical protein PACTADRAFT_51768 [Pachysolen tannophilus NRRL Y-2460]
MSYSQEILVNKFRSLDETQATIISISEWVLFHQKSSLQSVKTWSNYISSPKTSPRQKLPLFYLCNEVIQKSKATRKFEFLKHFGDALPGVLSKIYPTLDPTVQNKFKRVIDIWKDRAIFNESVLKNLYKSIDSSSGNVSKSDRFNNSIPDMAPELLPLSNDFNKISQLKSIISADSLKFENIYNELFENEYNLPAPDIYLQKLSTLQKLDDKLNLSFKNYVDIRLNLINELSKIIDIQKGLINNDKSKMESMSSKRKQINEKKAELEEYIHTADDDRNEDGEDEDDEEVAPGYDNSENDSEDDKDEPALKKQKTEDKEEIISKTENKIDEGISSDENNKVDNENIQKEEFDEDDENNEYEPAYNSSDNVSKTKVINPDLANLLSKLSQ